MIQIVEQKCPTTYNCAQFQFARSKIQNITDVQTMSKKFHDVFCNRSMLHGVYSRAHVRGVVLGQACGPPILSTGVHHVLGASRPRVSEISPRPRLIDT